MNSITHDPLVQYMRTVIPNVQVPSKWTDYDVPFDSEAEPHLDVYIDLIIPLPDGTDMTVCARVYEPGALANYGSYFYTIRELVPGSDEWGEPTPPSPMMGQEACKVAALHHAVMLLLLWWQDWVKRDPVREEAASSATIETSSMHAAANEDLTRVRSLEAIPSHYWVAEKTWSELFELIGRWSPLIIAEGSPVRDAACVLTQRLIRALLSRLAGKERHLDLISLAVAANQYTRVTAEHAFQERLETTQAATVQERADETVGSMDLRRAEAEQYLRKKLNTALLAGLKRALGDYQLNDMGWAIALDAVLNRE